MRTLILTALSLTATPALAQSYGGGGVSLQSSSLNWQVPGQRVSNDIGCIGGIAYGVKQGKRKGAEAHYCTGPYANMAMGGVHFGLQGRRGGSWLNAYNTVGLGWVGVQGIDSGRFDGVFAYTKPTIGAGAALNPWLALEGGLFLTLPINLVGVVGQGMDPKLTFPHAGLQATLLFGDFTRRHAPPKGTPREAAPLALPESGTPPPSREQPPRSAPPTARPPEAPPQGPLRPGDLPPASDGSPPPPPSGDQPLAIPG